jgi:hypothetical protein
MRATVMHGAGDVRVEHVPDAGLVDSTAIGIAAAAALSAASGVPQEEWVPASRRRSTPT